MRALVVGLGSVGRRHARNWAALQLGELLVCREIGRPLPEPLGVDAHEFTNLQAALDAGPDVVLVCNPTSMHVATAMCALRAGAHVLVEKPIGHALEGVQDVLAEANGRVLMVGYMLRFHPGLQRLRSLVQRGAIGRPLSIRAEVGEYLPGWHPWEDYRESYSGRRELGGGPILTFSHELDAVCWLLGAPTAVTAISKHGSGLEIDTEDVAEIILEFSSAALASVHVDYVRRLPRRVIEIVGEDGVLRWEPDAQRLLHFVPGTGEPRHEVDDPRFNRNSMFLNELRELVQRVRGESATTGATGEQGAAVLAIALAALRSAAEGRRIDLTHEPHSVRQWFTTL